MSDDKFKQCPCCGEWFSLDDVLHHPDLEPLGLTFEKGDSEANMFYFNHNAPGCGTTFVIPVRQLAPLIEEPLPPNILGGTDCCESHCTSLADWSACSQDCFYAPFRRFLIKLAVRKGAVTKTD